MTEFGHGFYGSGIAMRVTPLGGESVVGVGNRRRRLCATPAAQPPVPIAPDRGNRLRAGWR